MGSVALAGCGESGPVLLALSPSQSNSGENRLLADSTEPAADLAGLGIEFQVVGSLPPMPATAQSWSVGPYGEAMRETQRIADAFGMDVKAERASDDKYTFVAVDETTNETVTLWNHLGVGGWWTYTAAVAGASAPCAPGVTPCPGAGEPQSPTNLLSTDEALARAKEFFAKSQLKMADYSLTVTTGASGTSVTGLLVAGGVASNISINFLFGADGALQFASGPMVGVQMADEYTLADVQQSVGRLSMPRYSTPGPAVSVAIDTATASPSGGTAGAPTVIPITGVRMSLMETRLDNGSRMLLPAYTYANDEGDVGTVIALADEHLVFPDAPDGPGTTSPPREPMELNEESSGSLIGLTEAEAGKVAAERGWVVRTAMRDGQAFMLTTDHRSDRVNLTVADGLVTSVTIG